MGKLERAIQKSIIDELYDDYPGIFILKNDPGYLQGVPDILVLYYDRWGVLEIKKSATASEQPNQRVYVNQLNKMSFAAFIYPENREEVLDALQQALQLGRKPRVPQRF